MPPAGRWAAGFLPGMEVGRVVGGAWGEGMCGLLGEGGGEGGGDDRGEEDGGDDRGEESGYSSPSSSSGMGSSSASAATAASMSCPKSKFGLAGVVQDPNMALGHV
jgi:hypothetical protein